MINKYVSNLDDETVSFRHFPHQHNIVLCNSISPTSSRLQSYCFADPVLYPRLCNGSFLKQPRLVVSDSSPLVRLPYSSRNMQHYFICLCYSTPVAQIELKLVEQWSSAAENAQLMQVGVIPLFHTLKLNFQQIIFMSELLNKQANFAFEEYIFSISTSQEASSQEK